MEAFAREHLNFRWHLVLSEAPGEGGEPVRLVHEAVRDGLLRGRGDIASLDFYVCGPPAMLDATRRMLREMGVHDAQVAFDDFKV